MSEITMLKWDHDVTDPVEVTRELSKPFPREALDTVQGLTYIKYSHMIRRLIRATGNRFSTRLVKTENVEISDTKPYTDRNGKQHEAQRRLMLRAWVELDIPVLGSSRVHEGIQIVFPDAPRGEDMFKGAISDAIKKAAQSYGVGIELTGVDSEFMVAQRAERVDQDTGEIAPARPQQQERQSPQSNGQAPGAIGAAASEKQKTMIRGLWKETGHTVKDMDGTLHHDAMGLNEALYKRFELGIDGITKAQASQVIEGLQRAKAQQTPEMDAVQEDELQWKVAEAARR